MALAPRGVRAHADQVILRRPAMEREGWLRMEQTVERGVARKVGAGLQNTPLTRQKPPDRGLGATSAACGRAAGGAMSGGPVAQRACVGRGLPGGQSTAHPLCPAGSATDRAASPPRNGAGSPAAGAGPAASGRPAGTLAHRVWAGTVSVAWRHRRLLRNAQFCLPRAGTRPAWVRGPRRTRQWVAAKLSLFEDATKCRRKQPR